MKSLRLSFPFLFILVSSCLHAQSSDELDKLARASFAVPDQPGAAVLVMEKGKTLLRQGYGVSNMETGLPLQPDMVFRIGSITKQFTSTAILKLVQEGKISLQDEITRYLPGFTTPLPVTIEQLLNHTSGIKSYTSIPEKMTADVKGEKVAVADMITFIHSLPGDFAPGERFLYNNSGYYLLGSIIENVSGLTYREYITRNFLKPLGMKSTFVDDETPIKKRVTGYARVSSTEFKSADYVHPSIPYAAGSIFSTVDDLYKWNQGVFGYKLVKKELLEQAWTPTRLNDGARESYGYGWQLGRVGENRAIGHGGGIDGFVSFEVYVPDRQIYVCVLANTVGIATEEIAYLLAETVAGVATRPQPIQLDEQELQQYTGVYQINASEQRIIRYKEGKLFSSRSGGNTFELTPFDTDKFFFPETGSKLVFHRDASGAIVTAELISRSYVNQVAKKTNKPIPAERAVIDFDPVLFDAYAGEYELAPGFIIKTWRDGDRFFTQATGQAAISIFPESETTFFMKVVEAQLQFNRNEQGEVISLTLFQAGRSMPAKKIK
jgi:CubicO group peptidase (beta-lactamase class C family)